MLLLNSADGQRKVNNQNSFNPENLKAVTDLNNPSHYKNSIAINEFNSKAVRNFKKTFENINNEKWYQEEYGLCAVFFENDVQNDVNYANNGHWLYTMKQYDENKLPHDISNQIKTVYYEYAIQWVHEIVLPQKTVYFVLIQDKATIKNIRICDGEMEVVEDINKS